jgi:hypothetical protein
MAADDTDRKWRHVEQEWQRMMRHLRERAIQGFASDESLSDADVEFYRIVLRQTDKT